MENTFLDFRNPSSGATPEIAQNRYKLKQKQERGRVDE
jgi:hypothetical protein